MLFSLLGIGLGKPRAGLPGAESSKANKKGFYKYINSKRENGTPLLNGAWNLVENNIEYAEVLKGFSASIFTSKNCIQEQKAPKITGKVSSKDFLTLSKKDIRVYLNKLDILEVVKCPFKKILKT